MTQKVDQAHGFKGDPSCHSQQRAWARLSRAALPSLLAMIGAYVKAADLTVINGTDSNIMAPLTFKSYGMPSCEIPHKIIGPKQKYNVSSGFCFLTRVNIFVVDESGKPRKEIGLYQANYPDGSTGYDYVWRVNLDENGKIKAEIKSVSSGASGPSREEFNEFKNRQP